MRLLFTKEGGRTRGLEMFFAYIETYICMYICMRWSVTKDEIQLLMFLESGFKLLQSFFLALCQNFSYENFKKLISVVVNFPYQTV